MFIRRKLSSGLFIALSLLCPFFIINLAAQESPVLEDPIAHGAWLYRGRCMRCHQDYDRARLAENYNDKRSLVSAIGNGKCQVVWSRRKGGELNNRELTALADYFFKWEELGEEPRLQELVPFEMQQDIVEKKCSPLIP